LPSKSESFENLKKKHLRIIKNQNSMNRTEAQEKKILLPKKFLNIFSLFSKTYLPRAENNS
jgi:hypothetical protein